MDNKNPNNAENLADSSRVLFKSGPLRAYIILTRVIAIGIDIYGKKIQKLKLYSK